MSQQEIALDPSVQAVTESQQTLGEWLVAQRQAKGLSTQDVASRTNRNIQQITALESDDYSAVGSSVLLRAVVRHYAKAIGLNEETALSYLPTEHKQATETSPKRDAQLNKVFTHNGTPMKSPWISRTAMTLLAAVVLGLLAYWVFGSRMMKTADGSKKVSEPNQVQVVAPAVTPAAPDATAAVNTVTTAGAAPVAGAPVDPNAPVVAAAPEATPLATSGDDLLLKFKAASWVEIKDADGKVLLSGEQAQNTEQTVSGKLPLKVKIGNASNVEAAWKGTAYDLTATTKGNVARLNLE